MIEECADITAYNNLGFTKNVVVYILEVKIIRTRVWLFTMCFIWRKYVINPPV